MTCHRSQTNSSEEKKKINSDQVHFFKVNTDGIRFLILINSCVAGSVASQRQQDSGGDLSASVQMLTREKEI